jgi:hypothetical protein
MATLLELKTRIRLETNKDDIAASGEAVEALNLAIERAIEYYSDEAFWFNRDSGTASTTSGSAYVAVPYAVRVPETVSYSGEPLQKTSLSQIEHLTDSGQPTHWAENGGIIQLWPIPDATYSLSVYGVAQIDAPEADGDETVWTNEAYDLIAARARFLLYRDIWRDVEAVKLAAQAEGEALTRLRNETRRRGRTSLRSRGDEPWTARSSFNINRG